MANLQGLQAGVLRKLRDDRSGNVLAIVAASVLPMMALIGGGVDISRAYMAKTQLQAACDAGVLAGRRAMAKTGVYTTAERNKAQAMFDFNLDAATIEAQDPTFDTDDNDEGQVTGTASLNMPTAVMYFFGVSSIPLSAECMAELQLANVDVMFVLDTTGSMSGTRIQGLRDAVRDFHATIAEAVIDDDTRVRYGFVPYSTTVNARELVADGDIPMSYFRSSAPYQTRLAVFDDKRPLKTGSETTTSTYRDDNYTSQNWCDNQSSKTVTTGTAPNDVTVVVKSWGWTTSGRTSYCKRTEKSTVTHYRDVYYYSGWKFKKANIDVSAFKTFSSTPYATSFDPNKSYLDSPGEYTLEQLPNMSIPSMGIGNATWNGCIVERDTVRTDSFNPIPDGAYDLDLNYIPDSDETRWRPLWNEISYYRTAGVDESTYGSHSGDYCPAPMKKFTDIELDGTTNVPAWLDSYLNNLVATGNTYHDIGMIWGGRLASPRGIMEENVNEGDEENVSRHLIFMTDGALEPNRTTFTSYGVEQSDNRIGPVNASNSELATIHSKRFRAVCDLVKAEGYTIYMVAFGTSVTSDMKYCASNGRYYSSKNTTDLRNTFKYIASQVADLRLGK